MDRVITLGSLGGEMVSIVTRNAKGVDLNPAPGTIPYPYTGGR